MYQIRLKDLKRGEVFVRKPNSATIQTREDYDRREKKYLCGYWDDINKSLYLKGDTFVWAGFTF
tara:strand:+ start:325 stop:516 length:192 start_codon:yes stop_codon:yes gene_type:complete